MNYRNHIQSVARSMGWATQDISISCGNISFMFGLRSINITYDGFEATYLTPAKRTGLLFGHAWSVPGSEQEYTGYSITLYDLRSVAKANYLLPKLNMILEKMF